jgi:hypothetical protein
MKLKLEGPLAVAVAFVARRVTNLCESQVVRTDPIHMVVDTGNAPYLMGYSPQAQP